MTNFFSTVELFLKDGEATYAELRKYVEATGHIDADEKLGIEWDEGHQEIMGLREYV